MGRWILGHTSGIPADFFAGADDFAWDRDMPKDKEPGDIECTSSVIYDYY